jgi:mono/diheme cytochrome c family protein
MRSREWSAVLGMLAVVAFTACGGGDAADDTATADTAAVAPPVTPTPATPAGGGTPPTGATPEMVASGSQTFSTICAACHGPDAKGTQLAPNLTDAEWINIDGTYDAIKGVVKTGVPTPKAAPAPMPAMGGASLTDDQINAVAAYVWSLGGGK